MTLLQKQFATAKWTDEQLDQFLEQGALSSARTNKLLEEDAVARGRSYGPVKTERVKALTDQLDVRGIRTF